jgi:hypothetical protein
VRGATRTITVLFTDMVGSTNLLSHVALHGARAEDQALADADVGPALGHEGEDLPLALRQVVERPVVAAGAHERGDHLRVHDRSAGGELRIESAPGTGTTVSGRVPLA